MKKMILFLAFIFLTNFSVAEIETQEITNIIVPDFNHPAQFNLIIDNMKASQYTIYTLVALEISPREVFNLSSGENELNISVYALDNFKQRGNYAFVYHLKEFGGTSVQDTLNVKVVDFVDSVEIWSDINDIDSGEIIIRVRNKEKTEIKNITAKFSSVLFNSEETFDLFPLKTTEIKISVDKNKVRGIKAGNYILSADFETNKGVRNVEGRVLFLEKKSILTEEDHSGFFIKTREIKKINSGNVAEVVDVSLRKNILSRLFTSFNIAPMFVERNGFFVNYNWEQKLNPSESFTIIVKTNYIFPFLILFVAFLIVIGFKRYNETKIEVKKSVNPIKTKGGEFALRVKIILKTKKDVENVSLIDKIPAIVKVYEKFGSLKPNKIDAKRRRLQWDVGNLKAGEERVFSYVVYSKIGIVGKFSLPESLVVFEDNNEIHEVESNKVFFLTEQSTIED